MKRVRRCKIKKMDTEIILTLNGKSVRDIARDILKATGVEVTIVDHL